MSFSRVACWEAEAVSRVMNTIAMQVADHYFLATHHRMRMRRVTRLGTLGGLLTQEELRDQFLDPSLDYMLAFVLGAPGSGKSHLIQWLEVTVPRTESRHVVLIRRSGTNLKRVIELILGDLPGARFDEYRDRLRKATARLENPTRTRRELLNQISIEISDESIFAEEQLPDPEAQAERNELKRYLPDLLVTPAFRRQLTAPGGTLDDLANHLIGDTGGSGGARRELTEAELNVGQWELSDDDLPRDVRETFARLRDEPSFRRAAVAWINRNIDPALAQLIGFGGEDLRQLLSDVRAALHQQGKELVLLIEDLTKTQGLEHQLLEALLPGEEGSVGPLRAAIGITPDWYRRLRDNVKDRIVLTVDLDLEGTGTERVVGKEEIARFAARYMNAARLPETEIRAWYERVVNQPESIREAVPNACQDCRHAGHCQSAFGEQDGMGLYPFTEQSLDAMLELAIKRQQRGTSFNPRLLLTEVLQPTLMEHRQHLLDGTFPPPALLTHFGRGKMTPLKVNALRSRFPNEHPQYQTLFELWGDPESLMGVTEPIFRAFGMVPYASPEKAVSYPPSAPRAEAASPAPTLPSATSPVDNRLAEQLAALTAWMHGEVLPATVSQELRTLLFGAVSAHIDWDMEGLERAYYAGTKAALKEMFQPNSFRFANQETGGRPAAVQFELPLEMDRTTTSLGLQGLLQFRHQKNWSFDEGGVLLRAYAALLEVCSREVVRQLRAVPAAQPGDAGTWDPVPAAAELLALGALILGLPAEEPEPWINCLFQEPEGSLGPERAPQWTALQRKLLAERRVLQDLLRSRVGCNKGGQVGQIVDAARLRSPLLALAATWEPVQPLPHELRPEWEVIGRVRDLLAGELKPALDAERQRLLRLRTIIQSALPAGSSISTMASAVRRAIGKAAECGVWPGNVDRRSTLEQVGILEAMDAAVVQDWLNQLNNATSFAELLLLTAQADRSTAADQLYVAIQAADLGLRSARQRARAEIANIGDQNPAITRSIEQIEEHLKQLCVVTSQLGEPR